MRSEAKDFRVRTVAILVISLASGILAYAFNLLVDSYYGPQNLAHVLAALGAVSTISLPASLVSLPVSTWSGLRPDWRRRLPLLQLAALAGGVVSAGLVVLLRREFGGAWLLPLAVLVAIGSYLPAVNTGVLMGRASFVAAATVTMLPNLIRFAGLMVIGHRVGGILEVFWTQGAGYLVAGIIGVLAPYWSREQSAVRSLQTTPWASGWVALAVTAWVAVDVLVATMSLGAQAAAGFAVVALLGKAPFYLAQPVVMMVISEEGWGHGRRGAGTLALAGIALASVAVAFLAGQLVLTFMRVNVPPYLLAAYFLGASALSASYLWSGADAQRARHRWWPLLLACLFWIGYAVTGQRTLTQLVLAYAIAQFAGLACVVGASLAERLRPRPAVLCTQGMERSEG